jgi:SAM-dependent methyltransferase
MMETSRWEEAQANELAIWQATVNHVSDVFAEIAEAATLVRFGQEHGLAANTTATVVELGIGPMGTGWAALAPGSRTRAIGVDSLPQLTIATGDDIVDRFITVLQQRTEYLQADATKRLPFGDGSFDLIVCDNVVDHTHDPRAILAEGRRIVRSDGRLLFGVNVFSVIGRLKWRQVTRRLHPRDPNVLCHPHSFLEGDLTQLLSSAGWEILMRDDSRGVRQRLAGHAYRVRLVARPI